MKLPPRATFAEVELFNERAAIREFSGNESREVAEREAYKEIWGEISPEQVGLWK